MPTARPRVSPRPGRSAGSRWSRLQAQRTGRLGDDSGFTMVEMIVALVIIGIVMTALGSFFVTTVSATSRQGSKQAAVQLADDAIEQVRALKNTSVVTGRDFNSSTTQWNSPVTGVSAYQNDMTMAYDSSVTSGGATAALPTVGQSVTVNGLTYLQNWYVGYCAQPIGGGDCVISSDSTYATFYRVVVAVTWNDTTCTGGKCVFIATTLVSNGAYEPLFNSNLIAQPPKVVNPGDQTSDVGLPVTPVQLNYTGGAGSITWAGSGFPTGSGTTKMAITSGGLISGTPTATGKYSVTVTATDSFGLVGTATFFWTVVAAPVLSLANQTSTVNVADSYAPTNPGGSGTLVWAITNLPDGITYATATGAMSGTPSTIGTAKTVSVTVTDGQGQGQTKTFTWAVNPAPLAITTPPTQTNAIGVAITNFTVANLPVTASGGYGTYTWTAANLPTGITLASNGTFSGTPSATQTKTTVTITATDTTSKLTVTTSAFTWKTLNAVNITQPVNQDNAAGDSVSLTIKTTSAQGNVSWTSSTLPHGLTFTPGTGAATTATITGTPDRAGTYTVTLTATDDLVTDTATFTWVVFDLTLSGDDVNSGGNVVSSKRDTANITMTLTGGTAPYTWTVTNLPGSVTPTTNNPSSTASLKGSVGTANFNKTVSVKVTDKNGATATFTFTWKVS